MLRSSQSENLDWEMGGRGEPVLACECSGKMVHSCRTENVADVL